MSYVPSLLDRNLAFDHFSLTDTGQSFRKSRFIPVVLRLDTVEQQTYERHFHQIPGKRR